MNTSNRTKLGQDLLRAVDGLNREKNIAPETIFAAIEKAVRLAILKHYDDEEGVSVTIDRQKGIIHAVKGEKEIEPEELGRIAAQAAKQQMIQMFREEESNFVFNEYMARKGDLVVGTIQRFEGGSAIVSIGKSEALLPRSEQIPGETHHVGEKVKAVITEVKKVGHRVKIILSRTHPDFVRQLFDKEIPEIDERTIEIKRIAREAGYRTKVAVSSIDMKVDCVGACVGVRGSRIKNIVEVLGGERIDIVRWNESPQVLITNALQPAAIEEVFLYPRLERAVVLVKEDQLSLAIGRRGQNVRLASKLVGWDIEIMTHDELNVQIEKAESQFHTIPGVTDEMVEAFIEEGFLSYDDLTYMEIVDLAEMTGLTEEEAEEIISFAEDMAEEVEEETRGKGRDTAAMAPSAAPPSPPTAAEKAAKLFQDIGPPQRADSTVSEDAKRSFDKLFEPVAPTPAPEAAPAGESTAPAEETNAGATAPEEPPAAEAPAQTPAVPEESAGTPPTSP
jgi:N utilization substance protein A